MNLPDGPRDGGPPQRRLSTQQFELVIRRAAELQARESEESGGEGISEGEIIRIGQELGLSPRNLHRALAEVGVTAGAETGGLGRLFGPETVRAVRTIQGDPEVIAADLERYLVEREYLAVLRRFPDRVLFTQAVGMMAAMGRATTQIFSRSPPLKVTNLEMAVQPADDGYAFVALSSSLRSNRTATAVGSFVGGGASSAAVGAVLAIAVAPPAALAAAPILGLGYLFGRTYYGGLVEAVHVQLESLLDRLQHGDLPPPARGWSGPRGTRGRLDRFRPD